MSHPDASGDVQRSRAGARRRGLGRRSRQAGLGYLEVLVAAALIAIALVPATEALRGGLDAADVAHGERVRADRLRDRLETTLAAPYGRLAAAAAGPSTPSTLSDPAGTADRILVYLAPYDGDDADGDGDAMTGGDDGLLWVRVTIDGTALAFETVTAR